MKYLWSFLASLIFLSCHKDDIIEEPIILMTYEHNDSELILYEKINELKFTQNQSPIKLEEHLSFIASEHTSYMISENQINHNNFFIRKQYIINSFGGIRVSEIIAFNLNSENAIVNAWFQSEAHRKVLLGEFSHVGISIKYNQLNQLYCTAIFVYK